MHMEMKAIIISILLGQLCVLIAGQPLSGTTFCVKPSLLTNCSLNHKCNHAVECQTLDYYIKNTETINSYMNVTVYFLNGNYIGDCTAPEEILLSLAPSNVKIIGESEGVHIMCLYIEFTHNNSVIALFERMTIINCSINTTTSMMKLQIISVKMESIFNLTTGLFSNSIFEVVIHSSLITRTMYYGPAVHFTLCECTLHDGFLALFAVTNVTVESCSLINYNVLLIQSDILISGESLIAASNLSSAIFAFSSNIVLSGNIDFVNNTAASTGGAMALYSTNLKILGGTHVSFVNNKASDVGGAIYIDPGYFAQTLFRLKEGIDSPCFFHMAECNDTNSVYFHFSENSATNGGDDLYGGTLDTSDTSAPRACYPSTDLNIDECHVMINGNTSASSDPTRVCICNHDNNPQCVYQSASYNLKIHSGELFTIQAVVVGGDLGPTIGAVYAHFLPFTHFSSPLMKGQSQVINKVNCTELNYTLHFDHTQTNNITMYLSTMHTDNSCHLNDPAYDIDAYCLRTTPLYFHITLMPCLPGFTIQGEPPKCDCHPLLRRYGIVNECKIVDGTGYFSWNNSKWMNIKDDGVIIYSKYCPFGYCSRSQHPIDLQNNPDSQCSFNRNGTLCGGCKDNYSLAIGSSHCIHCPNNNNLALLIFFAAAGFILVFFIHSFNLTVSQGWINGLIFYANIIWTYQSVFFPQEHSMNVLLLFMKVFIAWINLDFGIETCFYSRLNAFWKTWLQFIFPLYIWAIAGLIIVAAKYSTRVTKLFGDKAVAILDTLFLLSYMKLLRIVVAALEFSRLTYTDKNLTSIQHVVWSVDGNFPYWSHPHIILFVAGLTTLLFLWLPYTLLLFLMQWLRRLALPGWITQFKPVYDAYFAPLKDKHHYWFGVLLLARTILSMVFISTFAIPVYISLLLLLVVIVSLLLYTAIMQPYNNTVVLIIETSFFANLAILAGFALVSSLYTSPTLQSITIGLSAGVAFLQFCGMVLYALFQNINSRRKRNGWCNYNNDRRELSIESDFIDNLCRDPVANNDEAQPLLNNNSDDEPTY